MWEFASGSIVFLIVLLFSNQSSSDNRARRLKDELATKNKIREAKLPVSKKAEPKAKTAPKKRQEPKVEESVAAAAAVEEIPVVEEKGSSVIEMVPEIMKEAPAKADEEPAVETEEVAIAEAELTSHAAEESFIEEEFAPSAAEIIEEAEETLPPIPGIEEEAVSEEVEATAAQEAYNYLPFDNTRAMEEFGLPKEDADLFIVDLIAQIEDELPALQVAVEARDNKKIEDISHMIKGSATNLGTGGAADVLVDFNTYMKTGDDPVVIAAHMRNLNRALAELKEQFQ